MLPYRGHPVLTQSYGMANKQLSIPNDVEPVMRGGRARWKIENETFNTLKNQGYNFEHNYGHGKKSGDSFSLTNVSRLYGEALYRQIAELYDIQLC
jgi:hypothetical protein